MELDKLIQLGGKRWTKGGHDRIYFNDLAKLIKFEVKTGSTMLNGKPIGYERALDIKNALSQAKFWYDVKAEKFHSSYHLYSRGYNLKLMLMDRIHEYAGDNEFTEILSEFDDI